MLAAMMLPSATPMVLLYSKASSGSTRRLAFATALFVARGTDGLGGRDPLLSGVQHRHLSG